MLTRLPIGNFDFGVGDDVIFWSDTETRLAIAGAGMHVGSWNTKSMR